MKRMVLYCTVLHLLEWGIFLLSDLYEEHNGSPGTAIVYGDIVLPLISAAALCLMYRFFRKRIAFGKSWLCSLLLAGFWFVLCGFAIIAELALIDIDNFPIYQHGGDCGWFLNGIEYIFFPICNLVIGCGTMMIFSLVLAIIAYRKQKKENRGA